MKLRRMISIVMDLSSWQIHQPLIAKGYINAMNSEQQMNKKF